MKFTFNIEKKHLVILIIFIAVIGIGIVIASTYPSPDNPPSHDTLWTKEIKGKNVGTIKIYDNLDFDINKFIYYNGNPITLGGGADCLLNTNSNVPPNYIPSQKRITGFGSDLEKCVSKCAGGTGISNTNPKCSTLSNGQWISYSTNECGVTCRTKQEGECTLLVDQDKPVVDVVKPISADSNVLYCK